MSPDPRVLIVTGGAGFIGSTLVRLALAAGYRVVTVDKLTYAGHLANLAEVMDHPHHVFERADIADGRAMAALLARYRPQAIANLAAETHVDRSIDAPAAFIETNVAGTATLLEAARACWRGLDEAGRAAFRFLHVSTDEVFGSLAADGHFTEESPYRPNSPYAASKAGSDHLARAWHRTFGLPVLVSHASNNYGPRQLPEKLIPLMIGRALDRKPLPVYGTGANVRDWLFVEDHATALLRLLEAGRPGETYAIGGGVELSNLDLVNRLCAVLDAAAPDPAGPHAARISFVTDRPGHDFRYALDCTKLRRELGWTPRESLDSGLARTVRWYIDNAAWRDAVREASRTAHRLGLAVP